jgi:hypothetical protein
VIQVTTGLTDPVCRFRDARFRFWPQDAARGIVKQRARQDFGNPGAFASIVFTNARKSSVERSVSSLLRSIMASQRINEKA